MLRSKLIFGVRPNSPVTTTSTRLVESARVDVLDQRGDGVVVGRHAEAQRVELVLVHRVIVPVVHATAERAAQAAGDDLDACLDEPPREQQLLAPAIATVAVARARHLPC